MMTPEEWANSAMGHLYENIAEAIRAAVAEEREACAAIVRDHLHQLPTEIMPEDWRSSAVKRHLDDILGAILARR